MAALSLGSWGPAAGLRVPTLTAPRGRLPRPWCDLGQSSVPSACMCFPVLRGLLWVGSDARGEVCPGSSGPGCSHTPFRVSLAVPDGL